MVRWGRVGSGSVSYGEAWCGGLLVRSGNVRSGKAGYGGVGWGKEFHNGMIRMMTRESCPVLNVRHGVPNGFGRW